MVGVYADNLQVTATNSTLVDSFFVDLQDLLVKDLEEVTKFLGMRISYAPENGYDYISRSDNPGNDKG